MNCTECIHHQVLPDPDPDDWFCDDDVKVVCLKMPIPESPNHRAITVACRPYNIDKECGTPGWCPLGLGAR
jgi:hypothetical protein